MDDVEDKPIVVFPCMILGEVRKKGLKSEDNLTEDERIQLINLCGDNCDCAFFVKNGDCSAE